MKARTVLTLSLCSFLALLGSPASAEILYDREGIQVQGTARIVSRNAATCNVLEEKYSPEEYQKMKANQGRPLHVWQLDISAHNLTGKPLDFLSATFNIESPWPPCTNWSGEGPGGGPSGDFVDAEGQPQPVSWAGALKVLSMPYGMRVGQVERDTVFLAVFHEDRPVFKNWSVDYTFARQRSQGQQAPAAPQSREDPPRAAPRQRVQLPPEILADKYLRQAEQLVREKDYPGARQALEKLLALQQEHGLEPDPEDHFRYAQIWSEAGAPERAMEEAVRYLQIRGREAEHYEEALDLINRAEGEQARAEAGIENRCSGKPKGSACWMELSNQPECYVWNPNLQPGETATWTGECSGKRAQGTGTLKWVWDGGEKTSESTGRLTGGNKQGDWVLRSASGNVLEGPYVEGKKHGDWVIRIADGGVQEGPYVEGKKQGRWVLRLADGGVQEGPYVDGKRHGRWVLRFADGVVDEGPYVEGKKHGDWVIRIADGGVQEGPYVEGKKQGRWVLRLADGGVQEGPYVDGKRHGNWVERDADGDVSKGPYVEGKWHGRWVFRLADGSVQEGPYVDDKRHGDWVIRHANGDVGEGPYVEDELHGRWVMRGADGRKRTLLFVNGKRQR